MRLVWVLQNVPGIREKIAMNQIRFGTLDTFLIHKLTSELSYINFIVDLSFVSHQ